MASGLVWKTGILMGASSIALGAFGAHGLKKRFSADPLLNQKLDNWKVAVQYQMFNACALLAASFKSPSPTAALLITGGVLCFSGSLYCLVLDSEKRFSKLVGPITPVGGLMMIFGWILLL